MNKDQFAALFESDSVREVLEYAEWLAAHKEISLTSAMIDILRAGKSRVEQLRRYGEKRKDPAATFRPYAPLKGSNKTRVETKRRAAAEGISSDRTPVCGFKNLKGEHCWLAPHGPQVEHRY